VSGIVIVQGWRIVDIEMGPQHLQVLKYAGVPSMKSNGK
jgi:hypothetical protein